jgi:Holliday junction resolvase
MENKKPTCAAHATLLNECWANGLRSLSSPAMKQMAVDVMATTGLSYKQIEVSAVWL